MKRPIYVAATGQHVGKTTSTLGLVANLQKLGYNVGYCKPVGQKHLTVNSIKADKDAVLFSKVMKFPIQPELHSPVILGSGVTAEYIDNPTNFDFKERLLHAVEILQQRHEILVYEGTGHPGVGSVVDLSNAEVASILGAGVIMVVEGGIGSTIDKLHMNLSLFREKDVPVIGVIVNKVLPEKMDKVKHYVGKRLKQLDLQLLGALPYDKTLSNPIMETINKAIDGRVLLHPHKLTNRVAGIVAGSLGDFHEFSELKNLLLVVSLKRLDEALKKMKTIIQEKGLKKSPISGVIVTSERPLSKVFTKEDVSDPFFLEHQIPVIMTDLDTYGSVVKINRIEVKINTRTPWKSKRAIDLIKNNLDWDIILKQIKN